MHVMGVALVLQRIAVGGTMAAIMFSSCGSHGTNITPHQ